MQVTSAWPLMEAWASFIFILGTLSLLRNHKQNVVEGPCLASPFEAIFVCLYLAKFLEEHKNVASAPGPLN